MNNKFDVVVIGAGPGGYVAAIRCAQLGLKTACVDAGIGKDGKPALGGTCLNVGCIPSKALLDSSHHYEKTNQELAEHGISVGEVSIDPEKMIERKDKIVKQLTGGVAQLFKANGVTQFTGTAQLQADKQVKIQLSDDEQLTIEGKNIILASGSLPIEIPGIAFDGQKILDNATLLDMTEVPEKLGIIGAGVIGLEMATVWKRLGSELVILEAMDSFLPAADAEISKLAAREFKKQKLDIRLGAKVESAKVSKAGVNISYSQKGETKKLIVDKLLVAVGRKANTENLLAKNTSVELNERGQIIVDDLCKTSQDNVWAIGDAVRGPMLAHKASEEGIAVAERIAGQQPHFSFDTVPWVIYTHPEIAWVGQTEDQLKSKGQSYRTGSFPFAATGRALAMGDKTGLVKIISDAESDRVLGVHILGPQASELIAEAVVLMEFAGSSEDLARIIHAHPTLSEAIHEAALSVDKRAIHKVNSR